MERQGGEDISKANFSHQLKVEVHLPGNFFLIFFFFFAFKMYKRKPEEIL
jgi:hypothetical protein